MQTYDYSSHRGVPGPEAPITWMEIVVSSLVPGSPDENDELEEAVLALRNKILLGIPFYGWACLRHTGKGSGTACAMAQDDRVLHVAAPLSPP
jgi:hypothetical protein